MANKPTQSSKSERYHWTTSGEPGDFSLISKYQLTVDHTYQRDQVKSRVATFTKEWNWIACSTLTVALREVNGQTQFWIIDGQHRWAAAMNRSDIDLLPCMCFLSESTVKEAQGFLDINTGRGALHYHSRFNGLLETKNQTAIGVNNLIKHTGRVTARWSSLNTVTCISALSKLYDEDKDVLRRIWPLMINLTAGEAFHRDLIGGLFYIERRMPIGQSITDKRWSERLQEIGFVAIMQSITESAVFARNRNTKTNAVGILRVINNRLKHKLVVSGMEEYQG